MNVQDSEEVYVGGDFNGHVGRESDGYERVHGGRGFGIRNASGETLLQAACAFDLTITNTWFNKREEHFVTYKSGHHTTQIDYFLVKRSSLYCVKNCKVLPGEALVTQHRLVILDVKITVSLKSNKDRPPPRIRWSMLEKEELNASLKDEKKRIYMEWKKKAKKAVAVARAKAQERLYNSLDSSRGQKVLYRITKERDARGT
ncbi:uncharacterized protein LOC135116981 [Helicoverpa armigera]|uniref:uncharacterized protein LOC135116981 n=1 Tax=Helicoverpa armigera TaxID=29058 RepID=UPI0030839E7D